MPSCALRKGFGVRSMRPGVGTRSRGWLRGGSRALSSRSKRRVGNLPSNSAIPRDFQPGEKVQPWLSAAGSRPGYPAATSRFIPNVKLKRLKKNPNKILAVWGSLGLQTNFCRFFFLERQRGGSILRLRWERGVRRAPPSRERGRRGGKRR